MCGRNFNSRSICQTEHFVIIKYSVHTFNPNSIDRAVKDIPILLIGFIINRFTHKERHNTVGPFFSLLINHTEKLIKRHGFWVQSVFFYSFELEIYDFFILKLLEGSSKGLNQNSFTCLSSSNHHKPPSYLNCFKELVNLLYIHLRILIVSYCKLVVDSSSKIWIHIFLNYCRWIKILNDSHEKRLILEKKFRYICISHSINK